MMEQLSGKVPIELTGRIPFPPIGELPYFVTLPPHGFYWFELIDQVMDEGLAASARSASEVHTATSIRGVGRAW
jgi:maltose alpha-D-glucosyltransferase/alpha-amylase